MKNFLAVLCVSLLLSNSIALAGGMPRGLGWSKKPIEMLRGLGGGKLAELGGRAKQLGAGLLLAGLVTCNMTACTSDEIASAVPKAESRVATLAYERSASLDEIIADLEQVEGAQVGIVTQAERDLLTIESDNGTVYLQLSEGEVLINNSESPLKVTLSEEAVDAGWIAEGSLIAIVPALLVGGGLLVVTGMSIVSSLLWQDRFGTSWRGVAAVAGGGVLVSATMGAGAYYLLVLL